MRRKALRQGPHRDGGYHREHDVGGMEWGFAYVAYYGQQQSEKPDIERRMRVAPHVHEISEEYVADVVGMAWIDLGVLGAGQVVDVVALDRLVQEGRPQ